MHIQFNKTYINNSSFTVAMVVANAVIGDSRVIKTATTLSKLGFRVCLFGMSKTDKDETLAGYPFSIELVANPAYAMKKAGQWVDSDGRRNIHLFVELLAQSIADRLVGRQVDILHTHDMYGLPIGTKLKLSNSTITAWVHDVHEHVEGCTNIDEHVRATMWELEQTHIREPDTLITVAPILVNLLAQTYGVPKPELVLNTPRLVDFDPWYHRPIRTVLKLDAKVPLIVYIGNVKQIRGVHTGVTALGRLANVHLALVTNSSGRYLDELRQIAADCQASERFHVHPYVPNCDLTSFLRDVNAGLNPVTVYENSDLALPNKIFEYIHSGIPIVSTATTALSKFLIDHQCGTTFPEGDEQAFADAVQAMFERYPDGLPNVGQGSQLARQYSWEAQELVLERVYHQFTEAQQQTRSYAEHRQVEPVLHLPVFAANQPGTLARSIKERGCEAASASLGANSFQYSCDFKINKCSHGLPSVGTYFDELNMEAYQTYHFHARPLIYRGDFSFPTGIDLLLLKAMGKSVFFHFRGSEMRLNSVFQSATPYNYVDEQYDGEGVKKLFPYVFDENQQVAFRDFVGAVCDEVFVNDPELQCYVPNALIVPRAIDDEVFAPPPVDPVRSIPLIVHAPSRRGVKGTDYLLGAVEQLRQEGYAFDFTLIEDMAHDEAMRIYRQATIIVDQLRIGWYGVLAVEGMALGKAVVAYVRNDLRHYLPSPSPLAFANPENITDVLRHLLDEPNAVKRYGEAGHAFARQYHQAAHIAAVLIDIYQRPFRPIDPADAAAYLKFQTKPGPLKKPGKSIAGRVVKGKPKSEKMLVQAVDKVRRVIFIAKHQGVRAAFVKVTNKLRTLY